MASGTDRTRRSHRVDHQPDVRPLVIRGLKPRLGPGGVLKDAVSQFLNPPRGMVITLERNSPLVLVSERALCLHAYSYMRFGRRSRGCL